MTTKIGGILFRCLDKKKTAKFYAKLGLTIVEHEHGGPLHFEIGPAASTMVVELYNASDYYPRDAIMIMVDSLKKSLGKIKKLGIVPKTSIIENRGFVLIYITDPDGRDVMLFQREKRRAKSKRK